MTQISFTYKSERYTIPNSWEELSPDEFTYLCRLLTDFAAGELSVMDVKLLFVCHTMGWKIEKIKGETAWQNIYLLARQIDFIFEMVYPDGALDGIPDEIRRQCRKKTPADIGGPYSRYLEKQRYQYRIDTCFARQLLPEIKIGRDRYTGYEIRTDFDRITCNLSALQFIDARQLLQEIHSSIDKLPLLAAILYYPGTYNAAGAHRLAEKFRQLAPEVLQAISINFQAFCTFIFKHTPFSILAAGKDEQLPSICTGMLESLYNLSQDGYGNIAEIEQMDCITYLVIIRKKLIEAVNTMHDYKMEITEIADKTGLPLKIIKQILS